MLTQWVKRWTVVTLAALIASAISRRAHAEKWTRAFIRSLPDSAFAAIEIGSDGQKWRRLPHHDLSGAVDRPHLLAALRLWHRTHWLDPTNAQSALIHLKAHESTLRPERR
jgi:hypothetical protein